jgi:predicted HicB family RNase H-like nuclease
MYSKTLLLRICPELHAALKQNRAMTGISVSEFVRRAILLALYADRQAANCDADKREPAQYLESR